jgi:hypothetical protein
MSVSIQSEKLGKLAARFEKGWGPIVGQAFMQAGELVAGEIRREIASWQSSMPSQKTGTLARSFLPRIIKQDDTSLLFGVYSKLPYARIHDEGGNFPITPAMRRAIFAVLKNKGLLTPNYVAPKKGYVTIRPKDYLRNATARVRPIAQRIVKEAMEKVLRGGGLGGRP